MSSSESIPVAILGGSGYVAGELTRLLVAHPRFELVSLASTSQVGEPVATAFPHLAGTSAEALVFGSVEAVADRLRPGARLGVFTATPHGTTAAMLEPLLAAAEASGTDLRVVDLSADYRFADATRYQSIYGHPHPFPGRLASFTCAVPEHVRGRPTPHATQPGCFVTSVVLAAYPFLAADWVEPEVFVSAVTGSSGSGRKPTSGTHHPERRSAMYAYSALSHRHEPEMAMLLGAACGGVEPVVDFVPHSGPFVRGIHATLRMRLRQPMETEDLVQLVNGYYSSTPFVRASAEAPRLTEVVGTNRCRLGIFTRGHTLVVTSVIDNLVKGAAGGGVQWMNRLFELPDRTGLELAGLGWY
jgi:N-acetyl-gamma-glutamyl-phosphate reductase common form